MSEADAAQTRDETGATPGLALDGGPPRVSREAALWAIRLFVGREPLDDDELEFHRGHTDLESVRRAFAQTIEFERFLDTVRLRRPYAAPLFLLRPPRSTLFGWRFAPPTLAEPVCQLCTEGQLTEPAYAAWCRALALAPNPHRKTWEFCFIAAALEAAGLLRPGARALGFGVGTEPLPALFAQRGVDVVATDAPPCLVGTQGWASTGQHAEGLEALSRPAILPDERLRAAVSFRAVDMNAVPEDLVGFDFCWSSCAFEHLGSIEHGLRFVERSLETLKPGGLAVHTTEFNVSSNDETLETPSLSVFRKQDIEALLDRLAAAGHRPRPLNLHPGHGEMDQHVDLPPFALPHLKLKLARYVTTSIGLVVEKAR